MEDLDFIFRVALAFYSNAKKAGEASCENAVEQAKKYVDDALAAFPKGVVLRGAVDYYSDLENLENVQLGDAYTVLYAGAEGTDPDGTEYAWGTLKDVEQWIPIGPDISGKADRVKSAVEGNLAELNADGNLVDSTVAAENVVVKDDIGVAGGVASLDENGLVPSEQLPVKIAVDDGLLTLDTETEKP